MRKFLLPIVAIVALAVPSVTHAASFGSSSRSSGSSFSSSSKSSSSSGSKSSYSTSSGSKSSSSTKSYSSTKATAAKPSTGPKQQPAPATRIVPPSPTPRNIGGRVVTPRVPAGRAYTRDRSFLIGHPSYLNPYGGTYFGSWNSPFFYMWYGSLLDGDNGNNAQLPQGDEGEIAPIAATEAMVISELLTESAK